MKCPFAVNFIPRVSEVDLFGPYGIISALFCELFLLRLGPLPG